MSGHLHSNLFFLEDVLIVARDVLSCQGTEIASGLKLRHFGGELRLSLWGRKVQAVPIGEPECIIVRSCPPMAPKFRIPGLFWEREYVKYTMGWGRRSCLAAPVVFCWAAYCDCVTVTCASTADSCLR